MRQHFVFVVQLNPKHGARQHARDRAFYFNRFFAHSLFVSCRTASVGGFTYLGNRSSTETAIYTVESKHSPKQRLVFRSKTNETPIWLLSPVVSLTRGHDTFGPGSCSRVSLSR